MDLILHELTPLHWAAGGAGIGLITLGLLFVGNRSLGVSTGFENICSLVVDTPYLRRESLLEGGSWRFPLLAGLLIGGFVSAVLGGGWEAFWDLGVFDSEFGWGRGGKVVWMFGGGVLIGFGTRLAGGCTSGHGVCGMARGSRRSIVATLSFMTTGGITVFVVRHLLGGAG